MLDEPASGLDPRARIEIRELLKELQRLGKTPLFDLGLRLGEGSGAALAAGLVKAAVAVHNGMATFQQAGVTGKVSPPS